jgi:hypothetical protein
MDVHHRGEVAVEVMRRDVYVERFGGIGNFHSLPYPFQTASMIATSIDCSWEYGKNWRTPKRVSHELIGCRLCWRT